MFHPGFMAIERFPGERSMLAHHSRFAKSGSDKSWPAGPSKGGAQRACFNQLQRRTFTPLTMTVRQTLTGFLTTTAPRGPAQPARTTPSAQTAALATVELAVMVAPKASRAAAMSRNERMLFSLIDLVWC
jgi:hypothetical protein